jgi:hypothetical protein
MAKPRDGSSGSGVTVFDFGGGPPERVETTERVAPVHELGFQVERLDPTSEAPHPQIREGTVHESEPTEDELSARPTEESAPWDQALGGVYPFGLKRRE